MRVVAAVFALASVAVPTHAAANSFDGQWSVVIITEKGDCDRAYRYPLVIRDGRVDSSKSDSSVKVSGGVKGSGVVSVRISYGDKSASGSGRMSGNGGSGRWQATAGGNCSGTWIVERRDN